MMSLHHRAPRLALFLALTGAAACGSSGGMRGMLTSVLHAPRDHVDGVVTSVDAGARRIALRSRRGETMALAYDTNTRVVYRSHTYVVTALAPGDQVSAHLRSVNADSAFYTDSVHVTMPVSAGSADSSSMLAAGANRP